MKNKKVQAFTLMELLAVLVILAIIALIVFPIIGDVITDSKMKAFKSSVDGLENAVDLDFQKDYYIGEREYTYENGNLTLNSVKGESKNKNIKVEGIIENGVGTVSVDKNGNTSLIVYNDEYCAVKDFSDKTITVEEKTEGNCMMPTPAYCFEFDKSTGTITDYYCHEENTYGYETIVDVILPSKIDGVSVITIGEMAFAEKGLNNVLLSDSVVTIEPYAFTYNGITSVFIPSNVRTIGEKAFYCNAVHGESLFIYEDSSNLPELGSKAYGGCE